MDLVSTRFQLNYLSFSIPVPQGHFMWILNKELKNLGLEINLSRWTESDEQHTKSYIIHIVLTLLY